MLILIAEDPEGYSGLTSLIEAFQKEGHNVVCSHYNFFYSNLIPDLLIIQWPEKFFRLIPLSEMTDKLKFETLVERLRWYKQNGTVIVFTIQSIFPNHSSNPSPEGKIFNSILDYSDIISHYCLSSVESLKKLYPFTNSRINIITHHGDYSVEYKHLTKESSDRHFAPLNWLFIIIQKFQIKDNVWKYYSKY